MAQAGDSTSAKGLRTMGLVAHDRLKPALVEWARSWSSELARLSLFATGTTGGQVAAALPGLDVTCLKSGSMR